AGGGVGTGAEMTAGTRPAAGEPRHRFAGWHTVGNLALAKIAPLAAVAEDVIDHDIGSPSLVEAGDQVGPDEPGPAGDQQHPQSASSLFPPAGALRRSGGRLAPGHFDRFDRSPARPFPLCPSARGRATCDATRPGPSRTVFCPSLATGQARTRGLTAWRGPFSGPARSEDMNYGSLCPPAEENSDGLVAGPRTVSDSPILIVPYMWIGDFVRGHSVVKLLRARFPSRPIDVLTTAMVAPLLDYMPGIRKGVVVDLPRRRLALRQHRALAA